jgi:NAD-dependent SIR2 family protein deacetylase
MRQPHAPNHRNRKAAAYGFIHAFHLAAHRVFVLTGARLRVESGIPTFPGVGRLWQLHWIEESRLRTVRVAGLDVKSA